MRKSKKIMKETTSRYEYNKARKEFIGGCTFCGYHRGCNITHNRYGDFGHGKNEKLKLPNWKLVSKNEKQWMDKRLKYKTKNKWGNIFTEIIF